MQKHINANNERRRLGTWQSEQVAKRRRMFGKGKGKGKTGKGKGRTGPHREGKGGDGEKGVGKGEAKGDGDKGAGKGNPGKGDGGKGAGERPALPGDDILLSDLGRRPAIRIPDAFDWCGGLFIFSVLKRTVRSTAVGFKVTCRFHVAELSSRGRGEDQLCMRDGCKEIP